jgi:hypothetical protein
METPSIGEEYLAVCFDTWELCRKGGAHSEGKKKKGENVRHSSTPIVEKTKRRIGKRWPSKKRNP